MQKVLIALMFSLSVWGCVYTRPARDIDENAKLYERLGGQEAITAVVKDATRFVAQDKRINGFFIGADLEHVEARLIEQICAATGGPCVYTGGSMLAVHTGMNITEAQFNAFVEDLVKALDKNGVRPREKQELLQALGGMKKDIVNR